MPRTADVIAEKLSGTDYLWAGSERQRAAARQLAELGVDNLTGVIDWALAGTVPLGIDLPESDLDILVYAEAPEEVRDAVVERFPQVPGLSVWPHSREEETWCVAFVGNSFPIEFFIQPRPIRQQRAFRHMVAEYALLQREGAEFARRIRELKASGFKTEPAFAHALGLEGDPYLALLDYESLGLRDSNEAQSINH